MSINNDNRNSEAIVNSSEMNHIQQLNDERNDLKTQNEQLQAKAALSEAQMSEAQARIQKLETQLKEAKELMMEPSHPLSSSLLLPRVSACMPSSIFSELEKELDQQYESIFERTHQVECESSEVVLIKTYWKSKVAKLEQKLKTQEEVMANSHEMTENMKKEMIEMKKERNACLEENKNLNDAMEKKIKANRNLVEQVTNLTTKHTAEYSTFQKTNETKNNKIMSLERTIEDQAARIKDLQQLEHLSHKNLKLLKKEHEDIIYRKDSELRNSELREEQSLGEIKAYKEQLNETAKTLIFSLSKLDKTQDNYTKSLNENAEHLKEKRELLEENQELLKKSKELLEKNNQLLKEREQAKQLNTLLKKKLLEERENNQKKSENGK
ncbi:hypothetical protein CAEBREN_24916 [Caenorhabditis brenneri]|uniref:Uncharacterized protein n=1 Tax=Caenorhabditis brenneri TaxID=135651 RepID=G0P0D5_CAEBE|nr:hypothetical protein CAEBREN_24916 [Caenorhabditis brenneri]